MNGNIECVRANTIMDITEMMSIPLGYAAPLNISAPEMSITLPSVRTHPTVAIE